jgi:hypothetical protein
MWEDNRYFWVVLCKYKLFHIRESLSLFFRYRIALGETDAVSPCPVVAGSFIARCDKCGRDASYKASEVLRFELTELPESFTPHPLFREGGTQPVVTEQSPARISAGKHRLPPVRRSVLERIQSKVVPYLRVRHEESPPPHWRRPPQGK